MPRLTHFFVRYSLSTGTSLLQFERGISSISQFLYFRYDDTRYHNIPGCGTVLWAGCPRLFERNVSPSSPRFRFETSGNGATATSYSRRLKPSITWSIYGKTHFAADIRRLPFTDSVLGFAHIYIKNMKEGTINEWAAITGLYDVFWLSLMHRQACMHSFIVGMMLLSIKLWCALRKWWNVCTANELS
jgi:hypothetical protein